MSETPELVGFRTIRPAEEAAGVQGDFSTPEAVVTAMYDALSGPAEQERERDWKRFRSLALPNVRFLICHGWDPDGTPVPELCEWDLDGFVADAKTVYRTEGFWEREIRGRTERFGNLAHRFSAYESRMGSEESDPVGRGVNSIQLVRFDERWWIASVVWDTESARQPIPAEYLGPEA